jgi:hypothetical protein
VDGPREGEVLGCHEYCQQAGGYGGGGEEKYYMNILTPDVVNIDGGTIPVSLECLLATPCRGAILIFPVESSGFYTEIGRSDMYVRAQGRRVVGVEVSRAGAQELAAGGGRLTVNITADYGDPACPPDGSCIATKTVTIAQSG